MEKALRWKERHHRLLHGPQEYALAENVHQCLFLCLCLSPSLPTSLPLSPSLPSPYLSFSSHDSPATLPTLPTLTCPFQPPEQLRIRLSVHSFCQPLSQRHNLKT